MSPISDYRDMSVELATRCPDFFQGKVGRIENSIISSMNFVLPILTTNVKILSKLFISYLSSEAAL